jgi:hypothetical protein
LILGQEKEYEVQFVPIGKSDVLSVFRDVTSRKRYARFIADHFGERPTGERTGEAS